MRKILCEFAVAAAVLAASPASAGLISVTHATVRMISPEVPAAAYFDMRNLEEVPIVLTGASSTACGAMMIHQSSTEGGMARMRDVPSIVLQPHQDVTFKPGGYHLMCMNPSAALTSARTVPIKLEFKDHIPIETAFTVTDALGHPH